MCWARWLGRSPSPSVVHSHLLLRLRVRVFLLCCFDINMLFGPEQVTFLPCFSCCEVLTRKQTPQSRGLYLSFCNSPHFTPFSASHGLCKASVTQCYCPKSYSVRRYLERFMWPISHRVNAGVAHTCVDPQVVLQIPSCGELLTTAGLRAHKRLLSIVGPHVHLQPLQHIETFPTTFCRAYEGAVIPKKQKQKQKKTA